MSEELKPMLARFQNASWRLVNKDLLAEVEEIFSRVGDEDRLKKLLYLHHPSGSNFWCVPCENCGKTMMQGERVFAVSSAKQSQRTHYFCSVSCQRQNVIAVKAKSRRGLDLF